MCDPMNPAPPVTSQSPMKAPFIFQSIVIVILLVIAVSRCWLMPLRHRSRDVDILTRHITKISLTRSSGQALLILPVRFLAGYVLAAE